MGTFTVDCELQELTGDRPPAQIADVMVDTGTVYTWLPEELLQEAGVTVIKKDIAFVMANGATITRDIGYAYLRSGEFETVDEVVFAPQDHLRLLGARTLEGFCRAGRFLHEAPGSRRAAPGRLCYQCEQVPINKSALPLAVRCPALDGLRPLAGAGSKSHPSLKKQRDGNIGMMGTTSSRR